MTALVDYIGQSFISGTDTTRRLYELEDELSEALHRVVVEIKRLVSTNSEGNESEVSKHFAENDVEAFCAGEALYGLLDRFASTSIPAARALLRKFSYMVSEPSDEFDSSSSS